MKYLGLPLSTSAGINLLNIFGRSTSSPKQKAAKATTSTANTFMIFFFFFAKIICLLWSLNSGQPERFGFWIGLLLTNNTWIRTDLSQATETKLWLRAAFNYRHHYRLWPILLPTRCLVSESSPNLLSILNWTRSLLYTIENVRLCTFQKKWREKERLEVNAQ